MAFPFRCACGKKLKAEPAQVGRPAKCPKCGVVFVVPAAPVPPLPQAAAPPPPIPVPASPKAVPPAKLSSSPAYRGDGGVQFDSRLHALTEAQVVPDAARCVQCGICSHNCPVGIDVRAHAWRGQSIYDSHCLTCSECVNRCPRGVLRFEQLSIFAGDGR